MNRETALSQLRAARLYGIIDAGYAEPKEWPELAVELAEGGAGILQVRAKDFSAREILNCAKPLFEIEALREIPIIINDHPAVAAELGAAGCHVGQDDFSVEEARSQAGADALIGKSTHSLEQAEAAEEEGADYIGVGPIFATPTKPGRPAVGLSLIGEVRSRVRIPQFCIGGIKLNNLEEVVRAGAERVVIVSGLLNAEDPREEARKVCEILKKSKK